MTPSEGSKVGSFIQNSQRGTESNVNLGIESALRDTLSSGPQEHHPSGNSHSQPLSQPEVFLNSHT